MKIWGKYIEMLRMKYICGGGYTQKHREKYIEMLRMKDDRKRVKKKDSSFATYAYRNGYKSQFYQDYIISNFIFPGKKDGVFLDIGGNHPIIINNTFYFEKIGWTGLAFEPQRHFHDLWQKHRKVTMLPIALGETQKDVTFTELRSDVLSGIDISAGADDIYQTYVVQQKRLDDVLKEYNIKEIDYVSLDVEGYEINVLNGINWDETIIKCLSVENNEDDCEIEEFLHDKGYVLYYKTGVDGIYMHKSFINLPVNLKL